MTTDWSHSGAVRAPTPAVSTEPLAHTCCAANDAMANGGLHDDETLTANSQISS